MFAEKIDQIMSQYQIKNVDLAKISGVSPSSISKFRRGLSLPSANSSIYPKIYYALDQLLSDNQIMELKHQYKIAWDCDSFCDWVCNDKSHILSKFSLCLCQLMDFFEVHNNTLAKEFNFDASLISKYRTGKRIPATDNEIVKKLGIYFAQLSVRSDRQKELSQMMNISYDPDKSVEEWTRAILRWMMREELDVQLMDKIFDMMKEHRYFSPNFKKVYELIKTNDIPYQSVIKKQGNAGLRELVILFLSLCSKSKEPLELRLFSNQDMSWMTEDKNFFVTWQALMMTVLECGHKVITIHNIRREDQEMFSAVEGWLPLHLSGNIESHYYNAPIPKSFSNTIFDCGKFAVYGNSILHLEEETHFYFTQDSDTIEKLEQAFNELMSQSQNLLETFYVKHMEDVWRFMGGKDALPDHSIYMMQQSVPIWHIQEDLLLEILKYNHIAPAERKFIQDYVASINSFFVKVLAKNKLFDYFYIADPSLVEKESLNFLNIYGYESIYYTKEHYERHLQHIIRVLEKYKNYHITLLNTPMHDKIKLFQFENSSIVAIKNKFPVSAIQYKSPMILQKFYNYMFTKQEQAINSRDNYEEVCRRLRGKPEKKS